MKKILIYLLLLTAAVSAVSAGGKKDSSAVTGSNEYGWLMVESEDNILPGVNPLNVKGDITAAGSSTVFPLSERMIERFKNEGYSDNITLDSIGSGAGFERWAVQAESDISNASRPIKDKEVAAARGNGREPIEFRLGTDALAVVINPKNDFASDVTIKELSLIFGSAKKWSDVNGSWPNEEIKRFIPGTDSGTFDYFVDEVFDKDKKPILSATNTQLSEDDNILVRGVVGDKYAVGFFGYAYYSENSDVLNVLSIESVEPSSATVDDATYPLARPVFMYCSANIMQEKPQVAAFIAFYLSYVNEEIIDVGYFPASKADLDEAKINWMKAMEGNL